MSDQFRESRSRSTLLAAMLLFACMAGCGGAPTTGGDTPVTTERLTGTRLADIRRDVSWVFSESAVTIENQGRAIPSDIVETLLGDSSTPKRIEAAWRLREESGTLHLSRLEVDDKPIAKEIVVPIKPAGHVRVNLGGRQYNVFRDQGPKP